MLPRSIPAAFTSAPPSAASSNAGNLSLPGLLLVQKLMERGKKWQKDVARKLANRGYPLEDVLILAKFLFDDTPAQGFDPSIIARMKEVAELALEIFQQTRRHFESLPADALMSRYPINNELFQMLWKEGYKQAALNFWLETDEPGAPFAFLKFGLRQNSSGEEQFCECKKKEIVGICEIIVDILKEWTVSKEGKQEKIKKRRAPKGTSDDEEVGAAIKRQRAGEPSDMVPDPSGFHRVEEGFTTGDDEERPCPRAPRKPQRG